MYIYMSIQATCNYAKRHIDYIWYYCKPDSQINVEVPPSP